MKLSIPCVIFAGGKSSRMLEDKSLLPFGGFDTLIEYQYTKLSKLFDNVYISAKENKFSFTSKLVKDVSKVYAPTAGFSAMFDVLKDERIFVLSVDSPFVDATVISELLARDTPQSDATIAKTASGSHPLCGIYHRSLEAEFTQMLKEDNHRLGYLLKKVNTVWVRFEDEKMFANLNHPHEYQEAISRLG